MFSGPLLARPKGRSRGSWISLNSLSFLDAPSQENLNLIFIFTTRPTLPIEKLPHRKLGDQVHESGVMNRRQDTADFDWQPFPFLSGALGPSELAAASKQVQVQRTAAAFLKFR